MKKFLLIYLFPILLFASSYYGLTTYEDEERFNNLTKEIRCPKCTSGSLASSNAPVSEDLKFKIAELINEKKSDEEIKTMFKRIDVDNSGAIDYSEFILASINRKKNLN